MAEQVAEQVLETIESNSSSIASLMAKLPGRKIDAYVRSVAEKGKPEQSELEGGYNPTYVHLAHLPLFCLFSDKANAYLQKKWDYYVPESCKTFGQTKLGVGERAMFAYMDAFSAGPGTVTTMKWTGRAIVSSGSHVATKICEEKNVARFTRWTVPVAAASNLGQGKVPWFVDMVEFHHGDPNGKLAKLAKFNGNSIAVRSGQPGDGKIALKFLDYEPKTLKAQKHWGARFKVKELCEALVLVDGAAEVQMEIVARVQRRCTVMESVELYKQFEKEWRVPVLRV